MNSFSGSKLRKSFAVAAAAALAIGALTVATTTASAATKIDPTWSCKASTANPVKVRMIEYFSGPARTPLLNSFARSFEKLHPGVSIEIISPSQADSIQKITQLLQAGTVDIIEPAGAIMGQALSANQLADIFPYFSKTKAWRSLLAFAKNQAQIYKRGTMYVVPSGFYEKAAFVHVDKFKAAGIPVPKTWEDIYNAKRMQKSNEFVYAMRGAANSFTQAIFAIRAYVAPNLGVGGYYTTDGKSMFTTPEAQAGLDMIMKIWKQAAPPASVSWGYPEMVQGFVDGVADYLIQDNEVIQIVEEKFAPYSSGKWAMAQMPKGPGGYSGQDVGSGGWSITSASKCKNVAADFLDYITQDPQASTFARSYGVGPVTITGTRDPFFKKGAWGIFSKVGADPKELKFDGSDVSRPCYGAFSPQADKDMQSMYTGQKTTTQVLKEWAAFWDGAACKKK